MFVKLFLYTGTSKRVQSLQTFCIYLLLYVHDTKNIRDNNIGTFMILVC